MILHIVNGATVTEGLAATEIAGTVVEYSDVLHEGPVTPDVDVEAFEETRARFLAACGWATVDAALRHIAAWRAALARSEWDEVVLWYEHDLFDQLLLIRLLNWWSTHAPADPPFLVSPPDYLGAQGAAALTELFGERQRASEAQLVMAATAWRAFTAAAPLDMARIVRDADETVLPHLPGALQRMLEEYPSQVNGLGRTEQQILEILAQSPLMAPDLFAANARREERVFMGDTTFYLHMERMLSARRPLIACETSAGPVQITDNGQRVLSGEVDNLELNGIGKWIGGVHLTADNVWRRDGVEVYKA